MILCRQSWRFLRFSRNSRDPDTLHCPVPLPEISGQFSFGWSDDGWPPSWSRSHSMWTPVFFSCVYLLAQGRNGSFFKLQVAIMRDRTFLAPFSVHSRLPVFLFMKYPRTSSRPGALNEKSVLHRVGWWLVTSGSTAEVVHQHSGKICEIDALLL